MYHLVFSMLYKLFIVNAVPHNGFIHHVHFLRQELMRPVTISSGKCAMKNLQLCCLVPTAGIEHTRSKRPL